MFRILVVEDDAAIRMLLDRVLSAAGHWVQTAPNAREATAFIMYDFPQVPDVAILDIVLPGISGIEYAHDLRQHFPNVRIIFMTGWQDHHDQHEDAKRLGALLHKPFDKPTLLSAVSGGHLTRGLSKA